MYILPSMFKWTMFIRSRSDSVANSPDDAVDDIVLHYASFVDSLLRRERREPRIVGPFRANEPTSRNFADAIEKTFASLL